MKSLLLLALFLGGSLQAGQSIRFKRVQLTDKFYAEGANFADINKDGKMDIISGPFWYEGPDWTKKHAFYAPKEFSINGYSDNFFAYARDFNGDGWLDILVLGFPGKEARLYLSPGKFDHDTPWAMSIVADVVDDESPVFTDITGDGKPEIVCGTGGKFGYFEPNWAKPTEKWTFVAVTPDMKVAKFTHGLGVGDVNGDGKMDLLDSRHWWEQPKAAQQPWTQHEGPPGIGGGAQMFAHDFDGDGRNDIASTLRAHDYGVAVFLNKAGTDGKDTAWQRITLAGEHPWETDYGTVFSQPHAMYLADINGDGVMDLVTGKRYWAHNGHGPDEHSPLALYWFETHRDKGKVEFIPHLIDEQNGVGVGTDVQVGDVNGDGLPDIIVGSKAGVFVMLQERVEVSAETAAQLAPKKMYGEGLMPQKDYAHGQSAQEALKAMQLPAGFKAELIASEPEIVQPIAMAWDERGRLWVVEGMSYPQPRAPGAGQDRIVILEDTKGNGTFDKKTVFAEGLSLVSGIEIGFGGVWVGAAPYMMFIADKNRDDKPDADPVPHPVPGLKFQAEMLLDGWGSQDTHETLNSFIWGPDGWLYGCQGVFTYSNVGKPGATDKERTPLNCCVWRYHPVRHEFEVFAHGTSNPWGLDYDQYGEFFVTACVIPHLYHIVPGARYQRQGGQHYNPYTYDTIQTIADHAHYAGNIRDNAHWGTRDAGAIVGDETNNVGGGHAHCGLAIYQSGLFPQTYRNSLIFGNLHGHRLVSDYVEPKGSTYVGKHGSDFMRSNDMNFIPVTQKVGPDGALYVSDWSDKQVCHRGSNAVELWDRSNGRIYRISYAANRSADTPVRNSKDGGEAAKKPEADKSVRAPLFPKAPFDLTKESDETLVKLAVQTENEWFSRMARRLLTERAGGDKHLLHDWADKKNGSVTALNRLIFSLADALHNTTTEQPKELRALWTLYALGGYVEIGGENYTGWHNETARVWAIRLMTSGWSATKPTQRFISTATEKLPYYTDPKLMPPGGALFDVTDFAEHTKNEKSPMVRREIASMLQNMPVTRRSEIATALLKHGEDKDDPYIPLLIWYGIEPLVGADPKVGLELAKMSKFDKITGFIYRRMGAEEAGRNGLITLAAEASDPATKEQIISTVVSQLQGLGRQKMPQDWSVLAGKLRASASPVLLGLVDELAAFFGDQEVIQKLTKLVFDKKPAAEVKRAIRVLTQIREQDKMLRNALFDIVTCTAPNFPNKRDALHALSVLGGLEEPQFQVLVLAVTAKNFMDETDKVDAINLLAANATGAKLLLAAVKAKQVPMTMLSPFLARQMDALKDEGVKSLLKEVWGDLNAPKADLPERKAKFRSLLTPAVLAKADAAKGRVMFNAICGQCHKLFGEGQNVGPDLTGSNRANLDYVLDNVLDPNAVIGKTYQLNIFELKDGRIASGVIKEETPAAYRIAMPGGFEQTLTVAEVKNRTVSKVSTMPEGLFEALPQEQLIELVAYLQSHASEPAKGGVAVKVEGAIEGEDLKVLEVKGGNAKLQGMGGFGSRWSGAKQLWWTGAKPGATLTLEFPVAEKGKYQLLGAVTQAKDYGIIDVSLDGKVVAADYDGFNGPKVIHSEELDWGTQDLDKGAHKLIFTIKGANPNALKSYMLGLDYVRLVKK